MKLKELEISGFKSFADKTKIEFKDGITGIVGPNGSGKSNIIEAIRWVMGESSAKSLRGSKMPDVIFAGTEIRKPLSRAQVSITFDNYDHFLDVKYDEVTITRTLYRNGDSQFQINRQDCRLKDIINLFMDTGLGKDSFSIISQGRVESIINSKPIERRSIIEEVAGVLEYKQDKKTAENKLETTSGYLQRVNDLVVELEQQVTPLEQQASVAKDYVNQKSEYDKLFKIQLYRSFLNNKETIQFLTQESDGLQEKQTQNDQSLKKNLADKQNLQSQLEAKNELKDKIQSELIELNRKEQDLTGQQNLGLEKGKYKKEQIKRINLEISDLESEIEASQNQLSQLNDNQSQKKNEIETVKAELKNKQNKFSTENINKIQSEIENLRGKYLDKMQEISKLENEAAYQTKTNQINEINKAKLTNDLAKIKKQNSEIKEKLSAINQEFHNTELDLKNTKQQLDLQKPKLADLNQQYQGERSEWLEGTQIVQRVKNKIEVMDNYQAGRSNYYEGVRNALKLQKDFSGLVGTVSDVIKVPKQYTKAIEMALGSQIQNVVVDSSDTAKQMIQVLKQNHLGRVTFLPKNAVQKRFLSSTVLSKTNGFTGLIGVANQLIHADGDNQKIVDFLLSRTLITDNLANGVALSKFINHSSRIVTLDGDVIGVGGAMTGGNNKHVRKGILQQNEELSDLKQKYNEMQQKLELKEQQVQTLNNQKDELQKIINDLTDDFNNYTKSLNEITNQKSLYESRQKDFQNQLSSIKYELNQFDDEKQVNNVNSISSLKDQVAEVRQKTVAKQADLAEIRQMHQASQNDMMELEVKLAKLKEQYKQTKLEVSRLSESIEGRKQKISGYQKQLDDLKGQKFDAVKIKELIKETQTKIKDANESLTAIKADLEKINSSLNLLLVEINNRQQQQNDFNFRMDKINSKLADSKQAMTQALDQMQDDYDLTIEKAEKNCQSSIDNDELKRKLKLLKLGIKELGEVNVGSIAEYDRVSTRYNFLINQRNDLLDSKKEIEESIAEIDLEASQRFKDTFEQIASKFSEVFTNMFGGGFAKLELTDEDDLLNTGIEIKAQPPGKKLQRLSLLSGGEKSLTAITLLFAILEVKPLPFCILDEVEAAFDEANVNRFANYLRNFRKNTQFIVITHRKGTMVECDVLFGVTMQESGVSKMVSVSINEID